MKPFGAFAFPALGPGARVIALDGLPAGVALCQAHNFSLAQVNGGEDGESGCVVHDASLVCESALGGGDAAGAARVLLGGGIERAPKRLEERFGLVMVIAPI